MKHSTPPGLRFLNDALAQRMQRHLHRARPSPLPQGRLSFCSNDYLALASRAPPARPSGAGASRLVTGEHNEHVELEQTIATYVGCPAALAFTSGYAANVGLLSALAGPEDLVISDALNHASLVDGARLSRAKIAVTPHLDVRAVAQLLRDSTYRRAFVVTESYFSMDADSPDLRALRSACDAHQAALLVDDSHAVGILGPEGRGLCAGSGVEPDAIVGTFGKAFGAGGAFVAGCQSLVDWLWNAARSFVFSTGISPALAAAATDGVRIAQREPMRRERALGAARELRDGLQRAGIEARGFGHIVPVVVGGSDVAIEAANLLEDDGIYVRAIRPPSVPEGTARLRFATTASHCSSDIERATAALSRLRQRGLL